MIPPEEPANNFEAARSLPLCAITIFCHISPWMIQNCLQRFHATEDYTTGGGTLHIADIFIHFCFTVVCVFILRGCEFARFQISTIG